MTATITARVDSDKKRQAEEIFNDLGMTLSGNYYLLRIS